MKITVLGSGGWGTAISMLLDRNRHDVTLWSAFEAEADVLRKTRENPLLKGVLIPESITISGKIDCAKDAGLVVIATPSFAVRQTAERLKGLIAPETSIVIVSKGIEQESMKNFSQVVGEVLGADIKLAALSGPSHAEEVARSIPTACVAAAHDLEVSEFVQHVFSSDNFRVYSSTDVIGVELGGALKNIIALCAGTCDGMGLGDNTIAMLMTRGLHEMAALCVALGGRSETLAGLAGVGDLIVTCTSRHSRNRRAGVLIGKGLSAKEAMKEVGATVEGYYAAGAARELSLKTGVEMPISYETYKVLYEGKDPRAVVRELMTRPRKEE